MSHLQMTPESICSEFRQAANKQKQIDILANLNLCSPREIACLLRDNGEELPKKWVDTLQKPARKYTAPKPKPAAEQKTPAEADVGITVGKLRELLADLPDATRVMLSEVDALGAVSFRRDYIADQDRTYDTLTLTI